MVDQAIFFIAHVALVRPARGDVELAAQMEAEAQEPWADRKELSAAAWRGSMHHVGAARGQALMDLQEESGSARTSASA